MVGTKIRNSDPSVRVFNSREFVLTGPPLGHGRAHKRADAIRGVPDNRARDARRYARVVRSRAFPGFFRVYMERRPADRLAQL